MQFSDYQNLSSSEKIVLAILSASKRLMGWSVYSGSVYQLTGFTFDVINTLEDSGVGYTASVSLGAISTSQYFLDRTTQTLYIKTVGSDNPNGRFIAVTVNLYFSSAPVTLPHDLSTGYEVFWEPSIKSTSQFGVGIDTIAQTSEAIEGNGTLTLFNDYVFWPKNFDKFSYENQNCKLYSYNRGLAVTDTRKIFDGSVDKQSYSNDTIVFQLKDLFARLRSPVSLNTTESLGARTDNTNLTYQRAIFGKVFGHVPTNIDQVLDGYPVTGTISVAYNSLIVTGSGTQFFAELSPDDTLILANKAYAIASVDSNTQVTLTTEYIGIVGITAASVVVVPDQPKRTMNRIYNVAGHSLREPTTTTLAGSSIAILNVNSTRDISAGDTIYIGTLGAGEIAVVQNVVGANYIKLATSLSTPPTVGTAVRRPAIQNVRIDDVPLEYYQDYQFNPATATLTLLSSAEANAAPIYQLGSNLTFTNGSRTVTGSGFQGVIQPGYMLGQVGNALFFEVCSVNSDTQITLRTAASFTGTNKTRYQSFIYDPLNSVLTLDAYGRTDDGTISGNLLKTAPSISKTLLTDIGLSSYLNTASFTAAEDIAYQDIGIVIPTSHTDTTIPIYRDVLNRVNKSVFGALVQNDNFEFAYEVLRPKKTISASSFSEVDVLAFTITSTSEFVVSNCSLNYKPKEYDYLTKAASVSTVSKSSDNATFIVKTDRTKQIDTVLVSSGDAAIIVARWSFLLQSSTGRLTFSTKMQGFTLQVGDILEIQHRKFFERHGGTDKRKILLVESVMRTGSGVSIDATDLSNAFNRVACINDFTTSWVSAPDDEKLYGGYITDQYGLINNDQESFETNLIW